MASDKKERNIVIESIAVVVTALIICVLRYVIGEERIISKAVLAFLFITVVGILGVSVSIYAPSGIKNLLRGKPVEKFLYAQFSDTFLFWNIFALIVLSYVPAYLALFPGICGYDNPSQIVQFLGMEPLSAANPLLHTFLVGALVSLGKAITGSYTFGFGMYIFVQWFIIAAVMARSIIFLKRRGASIFVMIIGILFFMFSPFLQILTFNSTKDILFAASLLAFTMAIADALFEIKKSGQVTKKKAIELFISTLLICLLRNPGKFIIIVIAIMLLILGYRKLNMYIALGAALVITILVSVISSALFHIEKSPDKENMSVMIQQLGMVGSIALENRELVDISDEDLELLTSYFDVNTLLSVRDYTTADPYKAAFFESKYKENPLKFISLWMRVGNTNKKIYRNAFGTLVCPYYAMTGSGNMYIGLSMMVPLSGVLDNHGIEIKQETKLKNYRDYLVNYINGDSVPYFLQPVFGLWCVIILLVKSIVAKKKEATVICIPLLIYIIGIFFGPVALLRYAYPIYICLPLIFGMIFAKEKKNKNKNKRRNKDAGSF